MIKVGDRVRVIGYTISDQFMDQVGTAVSIVDGRGIGVKLHGVPHPVIFAPHLLMKEPEPVQINATVKSTHEVMIDDPQDVDALRMMCRSYVQIMTPEMRKDQHLNSVTIRAYRLAEWLLARIGE